MATRTNYRVLSCEGGDQVGKGDAILNLSERLLSEGVPVTYSSFPIYATPFGVMVRLALKGGLDDFKFDEVRELKVRMALFALNRLEFMEVLLSNTKYKKTVIILDRSPFSIAVTLGYGLATMDWMKEVGKVQELIEYALNMESFMISKMNLFNCVVQMVSKDSVWKNSREKDADIYERNEVQQSLEGVYDMYQKIVGKGWKKVVTKTEKGWLPRSEISDELFNFLLLRLGNIYELAEQKMYRVRYEIGIEEILNNVYKGEVLPRGILNHYLKALRSNDKDAMYKYASEIGLSVGRTCRLVEIKNKGVRQSIKSILEDLPEIADVSSKLVSKEFYDKFIGAINE